MAPASRALDTGTDLLSAQQKEKKKDPKSHVVCDSLRLRFRLFGIYFKIQVISWENKMKWINERLYKISCLFLILILFSCEKTCRCELKVKITRKYSSIKGFAFIQELSCILVFWKIVYFPSSARKAPCVTHL